MTKKVYWALTLLLLMLSGTVGAVGLGRISVDSFLNEPLNARIELLSLQGVETEDLRVTLADEKTFEKAGLKRPFILSGLRFKVVGKNGGKGYIRVTSRDSIKEPYLDFLVTLDWRGNRITRQFTILLDPPVVRPVSRTRSPIPQDTVEPTAAAPAPARKVVQRTGQYGPVKRADTLWVIAKKLRPDQEITVEQMMMALLRANPDAFRYGNVNYLKRGAVLDIPGKEDAQSLSPKQARRLFREQTQAWKLLRKGGTVATAKPAPVPATPVTLPVDLAVQPESIAPIQRQGAVGSGASAEQLSTNADRNGDTANLRVIEPDPEWSDGQAALTEEQNAENIRYPVREQETLKEAIADSRQSMEAVKEINRNLQELRAVLEGKIDSLRQSLEQRDQIIADLQQRLERVKTSPAPGPAPQGTDQQPAQKTADDIATESPVTAAPEVATESTLKQMLEQGLVTVLDWAERYWLNLALGLVVLLLALLLLLSQRRRRDNSFATATDAAFGSYVDLEEELGNSSAAPSDRMADEVLQRDEDGEDYFIESGADVASSLTEADIYLAYRRYSQAEALIKEAINANPESMVLKAKLLEIYAFRKDKRHFVPYMEEIYQTMAAEAPEIWAKVVEMGGKLVPEHPLINAAGMSGLLDDGLTGPEGEMDLEAEIQILDLQLEEKDDDRHR